MVKQVHLSCLGVQLLWQAKFLLYVSGKDNYIDLYLSQITIIYHCT